MKNLIDAFWRAAIYCLHPRVIALSLLPLLIAGGSVFALAYFFWEPAVGSVRETLKDWLLIESFLKWMDAMGAQAFRLVLAPMIVVALTVPVVVVLALLLVAATMTPALTRLVAERRFSSLEKRQGAGFASSLFFAVGCTVIAFSALVLSIPLWFVPPLVLIIPPLIWGWLTYQAMSFDVLAEYADANERRRLMKEHRWPLLAIGIATGYLGAAPSLLWALSATTLILAPYLIVVSVWLYTLVFAFSSLWFAHYLLAALHRLRSDAPAAASAPAAAPIPIAASATPLLPPQQLPSDTP